MLGGEQKPDVGFHEGKACDAVIRVLEKRENQARQDVRLLGTGGHAERIELTCCIGTRLFAFEHTGIEPFSNHQEFKAEAKRHSGPITNILAGKLPPNDVFELRMPAMATREMRARELGQLRAAIVRWVETEAPGIAARSYASYRPLAPKVKPPGVPFEVSLYRFASVASLPGRIQIRHEVSNNLEKAREDRLRTACAKKFPKLDVWRRRNGARTILILEENDRDFTNPPLVFDALTRVENSFPCRPDEIYLITTIIGGLWYVHALRVDDLTYYDLSESGSCLSEFDPSSLNDLTGR